MLIFTTTINSNMKEIEYQIPPEGSLGLLAVGHIGLKLWRERKKKYEEETGEKYQSFFMKEKTDNSTALEKYLNSGNEEN